MKELIVRITDTAGIDQQVSVRVAEAGDIGRAAQLAIDDMLSMCLGGIAWPLFIDIHPAQTFPQVSALYGAASTGGHEGRANVPL